MSDKEHQNIKDPQEAEHLVVSVPVSDESDLSKDGLDATDADKDPSSAEDSLSAESEKDTVVDQSGVGVDPGLVKEPNGNDKAEKVVKSKTQSLKFRTKAQELSRKFSKRFKRLVASARAFVGGMTKKQLIASGVIVVIAVAGVALLSTFLLAGQSVRNAETTNVPKPRSNVSVMLVNGAANYQRNDKWSPLFNDTVLQEGDKVQTLSNGRVVLTLDDGSAVRLDVSTSIELASLEESRIDIRHLSGVVYSRIASGSYKVQVESESYVALGTAFATYSQKEIRGVQVFEGSVESGGDADVPEGQQSFAIHPDEGRAGQVTGIDLAELMEDEFLVWNLSEDENNELFKDKLGVFVNARQAAEEKERARQEAEAIARAEQEARAKEEWEKEEQRKRDEIASKPVVTEGLFLTASVDGNQVHLSWTVNGVAAPRGFGIAYSTKSEAPTYGRSSDRVKDSDDRNFTWKVSRKERDKTYWVRICALQKNNQCTNYSNAVKVYVRD